MNNTPTRSPLWDQPEAIIQRIVGNIERIIVGKRESVERCVLAVIAGGHVLIEDVPGTGKTLLVKTLARTLDASFNRIQFTPDLLPSDITGITLFNPKQQEFQFREGPLFANVILADELNRTSPKTQAALLEAMEEKRVTADGRFYPLPRPFLLLATQNPVEHEGTYALPEALLDRFLLRVRIGYPAHHDEINMLDRHGLSAASTDAQQPKPLLGKAELLHLQQQARRVYVDDSLKDYIVRLAADTRENRELALGASPRASVALLRAAQARALFAGRSFCVPDDIKQLVVPVYGHRLLLSAEARYQGCSSDRIAEETAERVPVPGVRRTAGL